MGVQRWSGQDPYSDRQTINDSRRLPGIVDILQSDFAAIVPMRCGEHEDGCAPHLFVSDLNERRSPVYHLSA
jgi:hypothetical protein